jgi:hypothetical protein
LALRFTRVKPLHEILVRSVYNADPRPLGTAPAWLAPDAEKILDDCQAGTALDLRLGFLADEFYEDAGVIHVVDADGGGFGFGLGLSAERGEILVAIAFGIQEHISEFAEAWGAALPACPGHTHPTAPLADGQRAWWTCPTTGERLQPLGVQETPPRR